MGLKFPGNNSTKTISTTTSFFSHFSCLEYSSWKILMLLFFRTFFFLHFSAQIDLFRRKKKSSFMRHFKLTLIYCYCIFENPIFVIIAFSSFKKPGNPITPFLISRIFFLCVTDFQQQETNKTFE